MISHVVCFKMKPYAQGKQMKENLTILEDKLEDLKANVSLIKAMKFELTDKSEYQAVAVMIFDNQADLDEYEVNPTHMKVKDYIAEVCIEMEVINSEI